VGERFVGRKEVAKAEEQAVRVADQLACCWKRELCRQLKAPSKIEGGARVAPD
jgi:hypothetical protein